MHPVWWFPIDSRLFPAIFRFGRISGFPKYFLIIEMCSAISVLFGAGVILLLRLFLP